MYEYCYSNLSAIYEKGYGLWICAINGADSRILKTQWIVDQLLFLTRIPKCSCLMFGSWLQNEIWIIDLSSALIGKLISSTKFFFIFRKKFF